MEKNKSKFLGDGVYAKFDGDYIWLNELIAIDSKLLDELNSFAFNCWSRCKGETYKEYLLRHKYRNKEILSKYKAGIPQKELAEEYKVSTTRIHMIISRELRRI